MLNGYGIYTTFDPEPNVHMRGNSSGNSGNLIGSQVKTMRMKVPEMCFRKQVREI